MTVLQRYVGVPWAGWAWVLRGLLGKKKGRDGVTLVVVPLGEKPEELAVALRVLGVANVVVYEPWDVQPYDRVGPSVACWGDRLAVEARVRSGEPCVVVTTVAAIGCKSVVGDFGSVTLRVGDEVAMAVVGERLTSLGYARVPLVQSVGQWAQRGGVMDVWPASHEAPVRMEWLGDEVESMRPFDPDTQRADGQLGDVVCGAVRPWTLDAATVARFRENYRAQGWDDGDAVYAAVSAGVEHDSLGQLLPLLSAAPLQSLVEVLPPKSMVILPDDWDAQGEVWRESVVSAHAARVAAPVVHGEGLRAVAPETLYWMGGAWVEGTQVVSVQRFDGGEEGVRPAVRGHSWSVGGNRHASAVAAAKEVVARLNDGWCVVLASASPVGLNALQRALVAEGAVSAQPLEEFPTKLNAGCWAVVAPLAAGWVSVPDKLLVLTDGDVFGRRLGAQAAKRKRRAEEMIAHFSELREGDYVVHAQHGIGRFGGLVSLDIDVGTGRVRQEFIKLFYSGDDRLLVPLEALEQLSRYKGAEAGVVALDKLGTGGWESRKAKVKEDLLAMAGQLLATAAARALETRPPLDLGLLAAGLYEEFCGGFPYELTDDQVRVMVEVEADLQADQPMDRLVVGDVGFGKTEVALRAAFLMAASGRQVAVVCPTTLLARQHAAVFVERFGGFPLKVAGLSRLVSEKDAKEVRMGLANGTLDVVVGTHALLAKDITFKDLGLVVVDEEQRFGVAHKERLKELRATADVLTLTATPIPRTLQMAVGGVRSLSLMTTPPVDRHAVTTQVLPWDSKTLKEAIQRELGRGGQVYVVAPHVEDLGRLQDDLLALLPTLKMGVAHGQMAEGQLEAVMEAFYANDLQVLLATTIIESGLDVANANTLIVVRADRFGLAQLYQLRGRVGRSTRRAWAYFVLPDGPLGGEAAKRLQILQRLEGLGSGFMLASYDMDLRGFGNVLGKQQSGHLADIGFELYAKMLAEAVETKRKEGLAKRKEAMPEAPLVMERGAVQLKLGVSYLIPDTYVPDEATRLQVYRRLASAADEAALGDAVSELRDRFGVPPEPVLAVVEMMRIRNRAAALNVARVEAGERGLVVGFGGNKFAHPAALMTYIGAHAGVVTVRPDQSLVWHRPLGEGMQRLVGVGRVLGELEKLLDS